MSPNATASTSARAVSAKARSKRRSYSSMLQGNGSSTSTSSIPSSRACRWSRERRTPWWLTRSNASFEVVTSTRGSSPCARSVQSASAESFPPLHERASGPVTTAGPDAGGRLQAGEDAAGALVAPLLLQVVPAGADELVVLGPGRSAERGAEAPGALVPVLVAAVVVPGVAAPVGDRLVVLVADEVQLRVGGDVAVRGLAGVAGAAAVARRRVRVRHVCVHDRGAGAREARVVGAVLRERAGGAVAASDPGRGEQEEDRARVGGQARRRDHVRELLPELAVGEADARVPVGAAARRQRVGVDHRPGEGRLLQDVAADRVVVLGARPVHVRRGVLRRLQVGEVAVDDRLVAARDRVPGRHPVDRVDGVRVDDGTAVVDEVLAAAARLRLPLREHRYHPELGPAGRVVGRGGSRRRRRRHPDERDRRHEQGQGSRHPLARHAADGSGEDGRGPPPNGWARARLPGRGRGREGDDEPRAVAERALDGDGATHRLGELLHDREPEPGADGAVRPVSLVEEEAFEGALELVGARPGPVSATTRRPGPAVTVTVPPAGVARSAFSTRFESTWRRRSGSASAAAGRVASATSATPARRASAPWRATTSAAASARSTGRGVTANACCCSRARSSRSRTSRSRRFASSTITVAARGGSTTRSRSASPWPRIVLSGVFSSWLTESRNRRSASRARASSSSIWLKADDRAAISAGPATGSGSWRSPAASRRLAAATRRIGRATAPASRKAATAAIPAPAAAAIANASVNGRRSAAARLAERSSTIARGPLRRAAYRYRCPPTRSEPCAGRPARTAAATAGGRRRLACASEMIVSRSCSVSRKTPSALPVPPALAPRADGRCCAANSAA